MSEDSEGSSVTLPFQTWSFALYWQDRDFIVKKKKKICRNIISNEVQNALSLTNPKTLGLKLLSHNPSATTIMVKDNEGFSRLPIAAISGVVIISSHCARGRPGGHQHSSWLNLIWVHSGCLARLEGLPFFPWSIPWFGNYAPQEHLITLYNWRIMIFLDVVRKCPQSDHSGSSFSKENILRKLFLPPFFSFMLPIQHNK